MSGSLWIYYRDEPGLDNNNNIIDYPNNNNNNNNNKISFKFKEKITGQTRNNGTRNIEIMVSLKYLSNFWRTLKLIVKLIFS